MAATRALLVDLITINNMCGGRMTVEEALRFKRLEDVTFDESGVRNDVLDAWGV